MRKKLRHTKHESNLVRERIALPKPGVVKRGCDGRFPDRCSQGGLQVGGASKALVLCSSFMGALRLTRRQSQRPHLSRSVLLHGSRQVESWLIFDVSHNPK